MLCRVSTSLLLGKLLLFAALTYAVDLQVGKAEEGVLQGGKGPSYNLSLKAGDYMRADLSLGDTELIITVYDPSGNRFRAFRLGGDYGTEVFFVAESTGTFRLQVEGTRQGKEGKYRITLTQVVSLDERLAPVPPPELYQSNLIKKLKADLSGGKPNVHCRLLGSRSGKNDAFIGAN